MRVRLEVPPLPNLTEPFANFWLANIFKGSVSDKREINVLVGCFVHTSFVAMHQYENARQNLERVYVNKIREDLGAVHLAVAEFESCITNLHRGISCMEKLRGDKVLSRIYVGIIRDRPDFPNGPRKSIRNIRNLIHYLEGGGVIGSINKKIPTETYFALMPTGPEHVADDDSSQIIKVIDRLSIGTEEISFVELVTTITYCARYVGIIFNNINRD